MKKRHTCSGNGFKAWDENCVACLTVEVSALRSEVATLSEKLAAANERAETILRERDLQMFWPG